MTEFIDIPGDYPEVGPAHLARLSDMDLMNAVVNLRASIVNAWNDDSRDAEDVLYLADTELSDVEEELMRRGL